MEARRSAFGPWVYTLGALRIKLGVPLKGSLRVAIRDL